jgi:hypothetical protein
MKTNRTKTKAASPEKDRQYAEDKRRFLQRIQNAPNRGAQGKIAWTRDDLHVR